MKEWRIFYVKCFQGLPSTHYYVHVNTGLFFDSWVWFLSFPHLLIGPVLFFLEEHFCLSPFCGGGAVTPEFCCRCLSLALHPALEREQEAGWEFVPRLEEFPTEPVDTALLSPCFCLIPGRPTRVSSLIQFLRWSHLPSSCVLDPLPGRGVGSNRQKWRTNGLYLPLQPTCGLINRGLRIVYSQLTQSYTLSSV